MKSIHSLIIDIQHQLKQKNGWFNNELRDRLSGEVGRKLQAQFNRPIQKPSLRLSGMGDKCPKALWHSIHTPGEAEPLPAWAEFKFAYGDIAEALAIELARAAGHEVTGEQDELVVDGIIGHRDCVIDGCVVDVKSASSRGFIKFKDGTLATNDSFGYLYQLDGYLLGSRHDPLVSVKDKAYILAVDKTLGHLALLENALQEQRIRNRITEYKRIVGLPSPPHCACSTVFDGKSGNVKLDVKASYNQYKYCCFPELRTFLYSSGPVYLTRVVRKPDVTEIDKNGKILYS